MDPRKKFASIMYFAMALGLLLFGCQLSPSGESPTASPVNLPEVVQSTQPQIVVEEETTEAPAGSPETPGSTYKVVDTGQVYCYSDAVSIPCPGAGGPYFGQDAQYVGSQPSYADHGDGTITDLNTNLMWVKDPGSKLTYDQAMAGAASFSLAGYSDWRVPAIKELYSLVLFSGYEPHGCDSQAACPNLVPFIDTGFFSFQYGQTEAGEQLIDAQYISSTPYVGQAVEGGLVFGVNFADSTVKGYSTAQGKTFFVRYVRGETGYGSNQFVDNGNGTISDQATGLSWMQTDSQRALGWGDALAYCENLAWAGFDDWRLPDAKELYSVLDHTRSPDTSNTAAINSLFQSTPITNEAGQADYGYYWTSTTHLSRQLAGAQAVYIAFGRAMGNVDGSWVDTDGAGAQRSDPKSGDPAGFPQGHGAQGDAVRILNTARCVRGGISAPVHTGGEADPKALTISATPAIVVPTLQITPGAVATQPPEAALKACQGKKANTECEYEWIFGKQKGVCNDIFGQLVCMPGVVLPTLPSP